MQTRPASPGPVAVGVEAELVLMSTVEAVHNPSRRQADVTPMGECMNDQESPATASIAQPVPGVEECCVRTEGNYRAS